jgi:apolipoprotein N-acyltransferase
MVRILSIDFVVRILAAIATGIMIACGFPGSQFPTMSLGFLLPIALLPLFLALETLPTNGGTTGVRYSREKPVTSFARFKWAFILCWISGIVAVFFAFFWVTYPAILFGKIPKGMAYPGFLFYSLLSGLYFPVLFLPFLWNVSRGTKRPYVPFPVLAMALTSTLIEMYIPRFFHWTLGSLMHSVPQINQWSSIFGFSGATAFIIYSNGQLARGFTLQPRNPFRFFMITGGVALFWSFLYVGGDWRIEQVSAELEKAPRTRIGYIQPNFTFDELSSNPTRSPEAQSQSIETLVRMSEKLVEQQGDKKIDLIVWPESTTPTNFLLAPDQQEFVKEFARRTKVPVLVQAIEFDEQEMKTNRYQEVTTYGVSFLIRPDGAMSSRFKKWIPIPFGETTPLEDKFPILGKLARENIGNLSKVGSGTSYEAIPYTPELYVGPLICFDSISPELARLQTLRGNASILVNQANFVWMERSNAGAEFMELDRFRAIENARSLLVAANTGPSGAFDPLGREIVQRSELITQSARVVDLPVYDEITIYTRLGRTPLLIAGIISAFFLMIYSGRKASLKRG